MAKKARSRSKKVTWQDLVDNPKQEFEEYSTKGSFEEGAGIDHKSFGKGIVQKSYGDKMDVLFEDKVRVLIQSA